MGGFTSTHAQINKDKLIQRQMKADTNQQQTVRKSQSRVKLQNDQQLTSFEMEKRQKQMAYNDKRMRQMRNRDLSNQKLTNQSLNYLIIQQNRAVPDANQIEEFRNKLNRENTPDMMRNNFNQFRPQQQYQNNKTQQKMDMQPQKMVLNQTRGDMPIDPEVMSNRSYNSQFQSERKLNNVFWSCKKLDPILPTTNTQVSKLFESGMGTSAPRTMRASLSMPKLNLNGFQNQFNRQRDTSQQNGRCMRSVLSPENALDDRTPIKSGLKMVDQNQMPNFRLNSIEKNQMTSSFNPLFQGKKRIESSAPTELDDVVFLRRTQQSENKNEIKGIRIQRETERKLPCFAQNHLSLENMAEQYKSGVKRKASQNPPSMRVIDNMTDVLAPKPQIKFDQEKTPRMANQSFLKNATNRSQFFDDQKLGFSNSKQALEVYKNMTLRENKTDMKHKNIESQEHKYVKSKELSKAECAQFKNSQQFNQTPLIGNMTNVENNQSHNKRMSFDQASSLQFGRRFGTEGQKRVQSLQREENSTFFKQARGQGLFKESNNVFRSQIQLF